MIISNRLFCIIVAILCCLTVGLYYPGLNGNFHFDDYPNIVSNLRLHLDSLHPIAIWEAAWSGITGNLKRPISVLTFSLNTYFTGLNPGPMKITNLVIHLLCGIGITHLSKLLLLNWFSKNDKSTVNLISLAIGTMWLVHPIQLTGVLYIVQRMTSLASLFSICAMIAYCLVRTKMLSEKGKWYYCLPVLVFGLLSLFSKEIGILIPLFLLCIEVFVYRFNCYTKKDTKILYALYLLVITVPALMFFSYLITQPERILKYSMREFTLSERLLTETRVVTEYLKSIISPNISELGLIKENIEISTSLFQPSSTLFSIIFLSVLTIITALSYKKHPYIGFGIMWFLIGHSLESTIFPLELRFEHRNYLPSFGIIFTIILTLHIFFSRSNKLKYVYVLFSLWLIALSTVTFMRATQWKNEYTLALYDVERYPDSPRANLIMGSVYQSVYGHTKETEIKDEFYKEGIIYFQNAEDLQPDSITPLLAKAIFTCEHLNQIPKQDLQRIKSKMQTTKLGSEPQNAITLLTKNVIDERCNISRIDFLQIMYAALSNPSLRGKNKAQVLANLSGYFGAVVRDIDTAIDLLQEAVTETSANMIYKIELSKLMLINGDYQGALSLIDNLKEIDKYGTYSKTINEALEFIENYKDSFSSEISN